MKVSWNWISRFAAVKDIDARDIASRFTLGVAEIDEVVRVGTVDPALEGAARAKAISCIKIAHVLNCRPHPQADRLQIVTVDTGSDTREIVSGAPNVRAGMTSVFADEGAVILGKDHTPVRLQEAVIRGVKSRGMLVSFAELGIGEDHTGVIDVPDDIAPGTPLAQAAFAFDDVIWDIDNKSLTHRPDCWGHVGLAREIAALCRRECTWVPPAVIFGSDSDIRVRNEAPDLCPRYSCFTMTGIQIAPSPLWVQVLLWRLGQRPINNVVDFTNLVMLTVGNPLHAFDRRTIGGDMIIVRRAHEAETFTTLDGRKHTLSPQDLVIADAYRPIALAGVMGGLDSMVAFDTTSIVLESANFHAGTIRKTAVRTQERTDSSARFEKSLDPYQVEDASRFFADLVLRYIPGAAIASRYEDVFSQPPAPVYIDITGDFVARRLGMNLEATAIENVLTRLQFGVDRDGDSLRVRVPTFRATKDISIPEDLVEEVGRWYGYDKITPQLPVVRLARPFSLPSRSVTLKLRDVLCGECGFYEAMTYSFNRIDTLQACGLDPQNHLELENPISSEEPVLRTHMAPNLLAAVVRNERREEHQRLVEFGRVYLPDSHDVRAFPSQPRVATLVLSWRHLPVTDPTPFFHMKDVVLRALRTQERGEATVTQFADPPPYLHPVRCAALMLGGVRVGFWGQVHPQTRRALEMESSVVVAVLDIDAIAALPKAIRHFEPLPRFPGMEHDLTVLSPKNVKAADIQIVLQSIEPEITQRVECIAVYEHPRFEGRRSLTFRLHLVHPDRTLTQEELLQLHERAVALLQERFDVRIPS